MFTIGGEWDTTDTDDDYGTDTGSNASSTCSSKASSRSQGRKSKGPLALMTRIMKKKKLRRARKKPPPLVLEPGAKLVVETLSTASCATVVWQVSSRSCLLRLFYNGMSDVAAVVQRTIISTMQ